MLLPIILLLGIYPILDTLGGSTTVHDVEEEGKEVRANGEAGEEDGPFGGGEGLVGGVGGLVVALE